MTNNFTFSSKVITRSKESFFKMEQLDIPMKSNEFRKRANKIHKKITQNGDFPGGPVIKILLFNAGCVASIPGQ